MTKYFNADCFDILPTIPDASVDLIFCDLPYKQTNCKWDSDVNIDKLWIEFKRIRKDTTPIIFTCSTKFGYELITANPKEFRMDLVWSKSRKTQFLQARKRPLCSHEMVYFFYKKQPKYNYLKYHKYTKKGNPSVLKGGNSEYDLIRKKDTYEPKLPASVIGMNNGGKGIYKRLVNKNGEPQFKNIVPRIYDPPLPASVICDDKVYGEEKRPDDRRRDQIYEPALPASVIDNADIRYHKCDKVYGEEKRGADRRTDQIYYPALPSSVIDDKLNPAHENRYDPPLPSSIQYIKSTKPSKHQTGKPVDLMEFILKYWTDEGDTIFDPTFGGGSMPIACKKLNREFIGCELNKKFYDEFMITIQKY